MSKTTTAPAKADVRPEELNPRFQKGLSYFVEVASLQELEDRKALYLGMKERFLAEVNALPDRAAQTAAKVQARRNGLQDPPPPPSAESLRAKAREAEDEVAVLDVLIADRREHVAAAAKNAPAEIRQALGGDHGRLIQALASRLAHAMQALRHFSLWLDGLEADGCPVRFPSPPQALLSLLGGTSPLAKWAEPFAKAGSTEAQTLLSVLAGA
jgi:hypothetical protein